MAESNKRELDFHTGDEVIAEISRLRSGGYTKKTNWNLIQACESLTATMTGGMDGFGFRLPWMQRSNERSRFKDQSRTVLF